MIPCQVAKGRVDASLFQCLFEKLTNLHEAIASLIIRKSFLESPSFAMILWNSVLKGKYQIWANQSKKGIKI